MKPCRVLVVGAGPAGLAAAARLLEREPGAVKVRVVDLSAALGGKAASYRAPDGFPVEHGWHMVVGFYRHLPALMRRAGVDPARALVSLGGETHTYEPWHERLHTLSSRGGRLGVAASFAGYEGLPLEDRASFDRTMAQAFSVALSGEDLTRHDDICFDSWMVERGLRRHITHYSIFRFLRLAYFNFPEQMSAYHVLETLRRMSTSEDAELYVARAPTSDALWNPIGEHLRRRGAELVPRTAVTGWIYDGDRITGVRAADAVDTGPLVANVEGAESASPARPGTERTLSDFDYVLSTVPFPVLTAMNAGDARMWQSPFFKRIRNLRSAATLSLTVLTQRPVNALRGPVHGLPSPLNFVVDMKPFWDELASRSDVGSALVFGGQESGFEAWTDEQIIAFTLDNFSRAPGFGDIRAAGITKLELHRNRVPWERLFLCEPGVEPFRPGVRTPFRNLFFAGDWVRNEVSIVTMEGAVASGTEAADALLDAAGAA